MSIAIYFKKLTLKSKLVLFVYIICFCIATITHSFDIFANGMFPYRNQPLWANIYWTFLTILDPLAMALILIDIIPGLILYSFIIFSDVIINFSFGILNDGLRGVLNIYQMGQLACLLFFVFSVRETYAEIKQIQTDSILKKKHPSTIST